MARSAAPAGASRGGERVDNIEVVVAGSAETMGASPWEDVVLAVTKELVDRGIARKPWTGFLGGYYSYLTEGQNETFLLHHYCWCEKADCPWCYGCDCNEDDNICTIEGKPVDYETYWYFCMDHDDWKDRTTCVMPEDKKCDRCRNVKKFEEYGVIDNGKAAPNFWHKPSGFRLWCYKWLGRDTEIWLPEGSTVTPAEVLKSCLESLANTKDGG